MPDDTEILLALGLVAAVLGVAAWRVLGHWDWQSPPHLTSRLVALLLAGACLAVALTVATVVTRAAMTRRMLRSRVTLQVLTGEDDQPVEALAAFAHQMLGARRRLSLLRWLDAPAAAFRVLLSLDEERRPAIYWQVPSRFVSVLRQASRSQRGFVLREVARDAALPTFRGRAARLELRPSRAEVFPLRQFKPEWDRLRGLADVLSSVESDEMLSMAWDFLPVAPREMVPLRKRLFARARRPEPHGPLGSRSVPDGDSAAPIERRIEQAGIWEKVGASDPMYRMTVLIRAESSSRKRSQLLVEGAFAACEQWAGVNFFRSVGLPVAGFPLPVFGSDAFWRRWWFDRRLATGRFAGGRHPGRVVTWREVGELFRGWSRHVEGVARREESPPVDDAVPTDGIRIGTAAGGREVALSPRDATHHVSIQGPWGAGKSTLTVNMALDAARLRPIGDRPMGFAYVDQKDGKAFYDLIERIPPEWSDRVRVIDPGGQHEWAVGLNVFDCPPAVNRDVVAGRVLDLFDRQYGQYWQHRQADILRAAVLTLVRQADSTLCDVPELLRASPDERRQRWTGNLNDPLGLDAFWTEYDAWTPVFRLNALAPLMAKLRPLLLKEDVRHMLGQSRSTIDVGDIMDDGKILLVNLAPGILGDDQSRLLGSLLLIQIWQAAQARASQPADRRNPFLLVLDECQKAVAGLPGTFAQVLAEARAYGLCLVLANQYLGQLPTELRDALANARSSTRVAFAAGDDARALESTFWPLTERELRSIPPWHAAVKPHHGAQAFVASTRDMPPGYGAAHGRAVIDVALRAYGRPREEVEADLRRRLLDGGVPSDDELGEEVWR